MPNRAYLEIINPNGEVVFHELAPDRSIVTIGGHVNSDIVIASPSAVSFHAVLDYRRKPYQVTILSGEGETKLGGRLLSPNTPTVWHNWDKLEVAEHAIILFNHEEIAATVSPMTAPAVPPAPLPTAAAPQSSPRLTARFPDQHDDYNLTALPARERTVDVEQRPYYEFSVGELTPKRQTLSWFTRFGEVVVPITNRSDRETLFRLDGTDEEGSCRFEFQVPGETVSLAGQAELRVQPGETAFVPVRITPLPRWLISLGKQTYFCTITTTMLVKQPRRRAVLAQLQCAPLIGPGLTALITVCLVILMGLIFPFDRLRTLQQTVNHATADVKVAQGDETQKTPSANLGVHPSEEATSIIFAEDAESEANAGEMTYEEMFKEIAQEYDLDWRILAQQAYRESHLDPLDIGDANEVGLMQILPSTWNEWAPKVGVTDPFDPYSSTLVAAAYLAHLKEYFGRMGYPGDHWMLAAYNWGPHNLRQLFEAGGGWAQVPAGTRQYVLDILQALEADTVGPPKGFQKRVRVSTNSRKEDD
jgi:hypothetical protein